MMDDDKLVSDFFEALPSRRRRKAPAMLQNSGTAKAAPAEEVGSEEQNLVHATMGFRFKCGVCKKVHKSSILEKVKSLKSCIAAVVKGFGEKHSTYGKGNRRVQRHGNRESSTGAGVRFLPNPETADTIAFTYRAPNVFRSHLPGNGLFRIMCPKTYQRFTDFAERLDQVLNREVVEELSLREALGAPDTMDYIQARQKGFKERAEQEMAQLQADQEAHDPEMFKLAKDWRKIKPEKFKLGKRTEGNSELVGWFQKKGPSSVQIINTVEINRVPQESDTIIGWFRTVGGHPVWNTNCAQSTMKLLFDIGLVNGFPAISWGLVHVRDMGRSRRSSYRRKKGSDILNFVSLWDGTVMLNMDGAQEDFELERAIGSEKLVTLSPAKDSLVVDECEQ